MNRRCEDFIANFTASAFDAGNASRLDLHFAWALGISPDDTCMPWTQKHHDSSPLFDTGDTTQRSTVHFGPKRDLVAELLNTAKKQAPDLTV
ncbi:hypothetical protein DFH08DRAFT_963960 [Mycena albidolilacea]|uniref:Uncharacterized protein n=1 Tax=Mycena albidolilacea TaxID=1033008 RepID=A0AAD6ZUU4_9AGAR|nr:hypothetical protein DFH08DRAFT_963960 [Mycena albidolilacea]